MGDLYQNLLDEFKFGSQCSNTFGTNLFKWKLFNFLKEKGVPIKK
jgi:hypothetical protein